jgi:hypothetical protein
LSGSPEDPAFQYEVHALTSCFLSLGVTIAQ